MSEHPQSTTYLTIASSLKSQIESGDKSSGDRLPSINDIASEWGVSRSMASRALKFLEDEGYVTTVQGKGTYVATPDTMPKEKSNKWKIFWSYAHKDDANSGGAITRLREAIQAEYELRTGDEDLDIFQDTKDLEWGEDWRKAINNNLAATSFFVPLLTPTYLRSPHCLAELRSAITLFENLGYQEGICPIDFVDCSKALRDLRDDRLANLLGDTQRIINFKALRYRTLDSAEYREKVAEIVDQLMSKRDALLDRQEERERAFLLEDGDNQADGDLLNRICSLEEAIEEIEQIANLIGSDMGIITAVLNGEKMPSSITPKQGVALASSIANKLEKPCQELERHCIEYDNTMQSIDDGLDAWLELVDIASTPIFGSEISTSLAGLHGSITCLLERTQDSFGQIDSMRIIIRDFSKLSRVLAKPCGRIDASLGKLASSRITFEGWERKLSGYVG